MAETPDDLFTVNTLDARLVAYDWPFMREHGAEIDRFWARETALKPKLFDGRVLLQHAAHVADGVFHAQYFETGYKPFLAWQRMGWPGVDSAGQSLQGQSSPVQSLRNGFAMAALRADDGAYLLGEMGLHTANAGKIYFAAGTPDLGDVLGDGTVDLAGSVLRELEEETGLGIADVRVAQEWIAVMDTVRVAFMRPVSIALPAREARALMLARIATQSEPELADIVIIRDAADIARHATRLPRFMKRYLAHKLG
jgi:8-oxo-dGTP pyrophosphatase MutT (NUDIX family)